MKNMMKIKLSIDLTNAAQLNALNNLTAVIGNTTETIDKDGIDWSKVNVKKIAHDNELLTWTSPDTDTPKKVEKKTTEVVDTPKKVEKKTTKKVETTKPEPETTKPEPSESKNTPLIKITDVRAKLSEKVENNRSAIKEKLTELGANNVTALDQANYVEFYDFLEAL